MGVGMHGFGFGGRAKQSGHLLVAFLFGFFGKCEVFTVGLGLTGKCVFKMLFGLTHSSSPFVFRSEIALFLLPLAGFSASNTA
jgi:hypothetical protein